MEEIIMFLGSLFFGYFLINVAFGITEGNRMRKHLAFMRAVARSLKKEGE